jgi:hypothetical protein
VPARSFRPAARRDEGPRSSLTDTRPSFGAPGVALRRHVRPLSRHEERSHGSRSCSNRSARGVRRRRVRTNLGRRPVTGVHVVLGALLGAALGLAINCRAALARTSLRRAAPSGQPEPAHPTYGAPEPRRRAGRGRPRCPAESRGARSRTPVPAPAHPHTPAPAPTPRAVVMTPHQHRRPSTVGTAPPRQTAMPSLESTKRRSLCCSSP